MTELEQRIYDNLVKKISKELDTESFSNYLVKDFALSYNELYEAFSKIYPPNLELVVNNLKRGNNNGGMMELKIRIFVLITATSLFFYFCRSKKKEDKKGPKRKSPYN